RLVARRRRRRARPGRELRAAVKRAARTRAQGTRGRAGRCRARLRGQAPCASGARAARRPPSVAVASALVAARHSAPEPLRAAHRLKCPPVSASRLPLVTVIAAVLAGGALAQDFPFLPESRHDPAIPTFAAVIGRPLGEEPSTHAEAERYLQALARASDRLIVERYGTSWEGRPLYNVLISAPANLARRAEVQAGMQRLADPRGLDEAGVEPLLRTLPAVAWLIYNVHGDEPSGTDAALAVAYHLCAALEDPLVDAILGECVTMLDPVQNPDGRDRFVLGFRGMRGRQADQIGRA